MARQRIGDLLLDGPAAVAEGDADLSAAQTLPRAFGDEAPDIGEGVIVIPDISGYTGLVSSQELVHAHEVVTRLMKAIMHEGWEMMQVSKLIGDAVLMYCPRHEEVELGDLQRSVVRQIRAVYQAFVDERDRTFQDRRICACPGCQQAPDLELKFVVHWGEFAVYHIEPFQELMGREVIVPFRLLKNQLEGDRYVLMTGEFMDLDPAIRADLDGTGVESYAHLGDVEIGWFDPAA
ncbi:DUF2652 domain-containing protein [Candidatus Poribacteria bacterium]|nr:DUF2652 domain-containing protein [Candidatus Poribacteria bacterium]MBT5532673.1 DUF2652 domain-containing protein [Candidatus Poribacteria bacterium]MBT5713446.1 DUF2652 domain-containing protein [Candidatus Poribacteria bacterium]MBT7100865.1 DUF2652 domain-containing protein [Candidatus Poribacteria bacterium]MBT7807957.1 DUF2652 domain-containing protein [Candidatus Poribacteria bacterium]